MNKQKSEVIFVHQNF